MFVLLLDLLVPFKVNPILRKSLLFRTNNAVLKSGSGYICAVWLFLLPQSQQMIVLHRDASVWCWGNDRPVATPDGICGLLRSENSVFATVQVENLAYVLWKPAEKLLPQAKGCLPLTTTTSQCEAACCTKTCSVLISEPPGRNQAPGLC